jgi:hypothetical protein
LPRQSISRKGVDRGHRGLRSFLPKERCTELLLESSQYCGKCFKQM